MKSNFNSVNAYENLINIIDSEGKINLESKKHIEACRFLEAIYNDGFNSKPIFKHDFYLLLNGNFDLQKIRRDYKLTQTKFAEKLGLSRSCIAQIEIGKNTPTKSIDKKIQAFLNNNPI